MVYLLGIGQRDQNCISNVQFMLNNQINLDPNLEEIEWRGRQVKLNNRRRLKFNKILNEKSNNKFISVSRSQANMDKFLYRPSLYGGDTTTVMEQLLINYQNKKK